MKKLTTLVIGILLISHSLFSQNLCPTAVTISTGTNTVSGIVPGGPPPVPNCTDNFGLASGAVWYRFQASVDGLATVSSDLSGNGNLDTRLTVYTGTCGSLNCIAGNDDIDSPTVKTSRASFSVSGGTFYYIVWDNSYSSSGFDFTISETSVDCSSIALPIVEDFDNINEFTACLSKESADSNTTAFEQQFFDWDGDGNDEDYVSNGSTSNIAKNDWLFSTPIDIIAGHEYTITFKYNGADGTFAANENLDVMFMDGNTSGSSALTTLFSATGIVKNGTNQQAESLATNQSIDYTSTVTGTYFLAFNGTSEANTGSLMLFEYSVVDNTLDINEFELAGLSKTFDSFSDILTIKSKNLALEGIEIFDILGQKIIDKPLSKVVEKIDLSGINDGIYIIRISLPGYNATAKLLKR